MTANSPSSQGSARLRDQGYAIFEDLVSPDLIVGLNADLETHFAGTAFSQGCFSGTGTRRFAGLLKRSSHAAHLVEHDVILALADDLLGPWCDHFSLNLTQAIELAPEASQQVPHRDQDMWPCSGFIDRERGMEFLINVMWPLSAFTQDNGATLVWPRSHRRQDELLITPEEAVIAEMAPGSALVFLGSTLHAAGANRTALPRRGVIISYCLGWLKPYELPWLAYPPEVARTFPRSLARLAGYRVHRPNLGTFEGRCPSLLLEEAAGPSGAIDALLPEQEALIAAWRQGADAPGGHPTMLPAHLNSGAASLGTEQAGG
ncbi:phytanoyl-CoA dioxygenase family protein [Novosphingobium sp. BW1]|uniref:phytanoyl-CoA dioxygenase family protein n=1 Tax=Novosphingobium sp. BW1 TaxID=2592621 RepID=UPI0011DEF191|nr:phytanoyl-CoA dioxygenase family protein [Novosphingobium sp. BW1]TYC83760.1 phytanoyl-CoA dioxygenase family protein [Novosphingobium sp. BW1]